MVNIKEINDQGKELSNKTRKYLSNTKEFILELQKLLVEGLTIKFTLQRFKKVILKIQKNAFNKSKNI